ncbi:hypothetical protein, partial [Pseudovibrio exalbescens]|uniref:hypothetical protein n=1 Tax=Pseudovibrio exalbescens TaxID=197461 RepID=UPI001AD93D36
MVSTVVHESFEMPLEAFRKRTAGWLDAADGELIAELRRLWEAEIARVPGNEPDLGETPVPFDALLPLLAGVVDDCRIILDNSKSVKRLDY